MSHLFFAPTTGVPRCRRHERLTAAFPARCCAVQKIPTIRSPACPDHMTRKRQSGGDLTREVIYPQGWGPLTLTHENGQPLAIGCNSERNSQAIKTRYLS